MTETREQRESRIAAGITGFLQVWFQPARVIESSEMQAFVESEACPEKLRSLLIQTHNLLVQNSLYADLSEVFDGD